MMPPPTTLRLPPRLREKIQQSAKANGRSVSQELVSRIEWSFANDLYGARDEEVSKNIGADIIEIWSRMDERD
jgi:hypothetical protein